MGSEKKKKSKSKLKVSESVTQIRAYEEETTIDLYELLLKFLDKWYFIVLGAVIGALIMLFYTLWFVTPKYEATSKIYVISSKNSVINVSDFQISNYLASDYIEVFSNWELHEEVIKDLEHRKAEGEEELQNLDISSYTYTKLGNMLSVSNPSGTRILYIKVTSPNSAEAAILANTYARVGREFMAMRMDTAEPKEFESARVPNLPASPNKVRNTLIGFVLGALVAGFIITIRYLMDDYVRTADDVEKYLHLPTLGTVMLQKQSDDDSDPDKKHRRKGESDDDDDEDDE